MKKLILSFFLALVLSVIFSSFTDMFCFCSNTVSTFYTISGIMFSIGMGLLATTDISRIKDQAFQKIIQNEYSALQRDYLVYFFTISLLFVCTIGYMSSKQLIEFKCFKMVLRLNEFVGFVMLLSIWYFTTNFLALQNLIKQINEKLNSK